MSKADKRGRGDTVDDFQHMTNWKRVFEHIWSQIRWLNSYGHINELALRKIMKKFSKNFFESKDNPIRETLAGFIKKQSFTSPEGKMSEELQILCDDLLKFYADCFTKGSVKNARSALDGQQNEVRRSDLLMMGLTGGAMLMLLPLAVFLLLIPPQKREGEDKDHWE